MTDRALRRPAYDPAQVLSRAAGVILPNLSGIQFAGRDSHNGSLRVGVDLGTAYTVLAVINQFGNPLIGEYCFSQVVRDGLVVDFLGAVDLLRSMKANVEQHLGTKLAHAAGAYPPNVPLVERQATVHVIEAAGMICQGLIDEPTAANAVLRLQDGVIVDVGGGTTGLAIIEDGEVVYTADEATGGVHLSLVIAGAQDISLEEAETLKKDPSQHSRLFPIVRPVMEKMGTIVKKHIQGFSAKTITLVGGTPLFQGMESVIEDVTGLPTQVSQHPMFVTPLGIAMHDRREDM